MLKTLIVLPDGTEIFSGVGEKNAIQSVTITECVNGAQELTLGSCCANMVEAKLLTPNGELSVAAGDELSVYRVADNGTRYIVGLFTTEKPQRTTAHSMSITAYDRVSWLDKDLTVWLENLKNWPYRLQELAEMVCDQCGLTLINEEIPNGDHPVLRFSGDGITGRQIMQWIGEVAGRFCRATPDGMIEFAWYTPTSIAVGCSDANGTKVTYENGDLEIQIEDAQIAADMDRLIVNSGYLQARDNDEGNLLLAVECQYYFQNGLSFEDYVTDTVKKVQLRQNEEDVGTVYPDGIEGAVNTYIITGNPLLTALGGDSLFPIAKSIYEQLQGVTYTPCKVSIPGNMYIRAGHTVQITDRNGKTITAYVMTKTQKGQRDTLECTGSPSRNSTTAANNRSYQALSGKVLNLRADVDGLMLENKDSADRFSQLKLDVGGILGTVSRQDTEAQGIKNQLTQLQQTAQGLTVSVQTIQDEGATKIKTAMGYTFDDAGLHIAKEGQSMENKLNHEGMQVSRSGQVILQADHRGVTAVDVSVGNYLVMGKHARFEDFGAGRTACFWLEG